MNVRKNFFNNFSNANGCSLDVKKDILLDEIAQLISKHKPLVVEALNKNGANIKPSISDKNTASLVVDYIYKSEEFRNDINMLVIALNSDVLTSDFYSAEGGFLDKIKSLFNKNGGADSVGDVANSTASGASGGGLVGAIVGLVGGVTQSVFNQKAAKADLAREKEATKSELYKKLLGGDKKTNWIPIIVVGGVFLVGAIILITTLKRK